MALQWLAGSGLATCDICCDLLRFSGLPTSPQCKLLAANALEIRLLFTQQYNVIRFKSVILS
jgi:hypothetical protein